MLTFWYSWVKTVKDGSYQNIKKYYYRKDFITLDDESRLTVNQKDYSPHEKTCCMPISANNKDADQTAHLRSLISTFVFAA